MTSGTKRILLAEDDHLQAMDIQFKLNQVSAPAPMQLVFDVVDSEWAACEVICDTAVRSQYDCFIIDLMLPWDKTGKAPIPPMSMSGSAPMVHYGLVFVSSRHYGEQRTRHAANASP